MSFGGGAGAWNQMLSVRAPLAVVLGSRRPQTTSDLWQAQQATRRITSEFATMKELRDFGLRCGVFLDSPRIANSARFPKAVPLIRRTCTRNRPGLTCAHRLIESRTRAMSTSVDALLHICEGYRTLGPVFEKYRGLYQGHTLLPNALSPILPGMAYGYDSNCGEIQVALDIDPLWKEWKPRLTDAYKVFREASGNKVLWAAWNYWDPTRPSNEQRIIQVVIGDDVEISKRACDTGPILGDSGLALSPNDLRLAGQTRRNNAHCNLHNTSDVVNNRDFAEGIWHEVFRPSLTRFENELQLLTIIDYVKERFASSLKRDLADPPALSAYAFKLGAKPKEEVNAISCDLPDVSAVWSWIESLVDPAERSAPGERLISAWAKAAHLFRNNPSAVPPDVSAIVEGFARDLRIDKELDQAYAILQHVAWFQKALLSNYQYVLPVASGTYFSAMYLSMQAPIKGLELIAWNQLAFQLFSSLIVHHLSDLLKRVEEERKADEQRLVLSHAIPKFVFKPMEYFATKLASSNREKDKGYRKISDALLFLSSRGQSALAEYAPPLARSGPDDPTRDHGAALQVDIAGVLENVKEVFEQVREFLVHGYIDRAVKRTAGKVPFRDELCDDCAIRLSLDMKPPHIVEGNRGLLLLHFWNLIDNAVRHANFAAAFRKTDGVLTDALVLTFTGKKISDTAYQLCFTNTGEKVPEKPLSWLNELFTHRNSTDEFRQASAQLASKVEFDFPGQLEHERSGMGLTWFAEHLWTIWGKCVPPAGRVGSVVTSAKETCFSFFFPLGR